VRVIGGGPIGTWQCYRILAQEWSAPLGVDSFKLLF
jgi:hypothetical protein